MKKICENFKAHQLQPTLRKNQGLKSLGFVLSGSVFDVFVFWAYEFWISSEFIQDQPNPLVSMIGWKFRNQGQCVANAALLALLKERNLRPVTAIHRDEFFDVPPEKIDVNQVIDVIVRSHGSAGDGRDKREPRDRKIEPGEDRRRASFALGVIGIISIDPGLAIPFLPLRLSPTISLEPGGLTSASYSLPPRPCALLASIPALPLLPTTTTATTTTTTTTTTITTTTSNSSSSSTTLQSAYCEWSLQVVHHLELLRVRICMIMEHADRSWLRSHLRAARFPCLFVTYVSSEHRPHLSACLATTTTTTTTTTPTTTTSTIRLRDSCVAYVNIYSERSRCQARTRPEPGEAGEGRAPCVCCILGLLDVRQADHFRHGIRKNSRIGSLGGGAFDLRGNKPAMLLVVRGL
ncbi:hypothetical protein EAI_13516 [Harpegnathos saltator]|uniref:Uncharacterized protein n=1 Tax=Harpegnathos saltator TaxID=610380 RepID=E2B9D5_HARSA|nr:hypothetical protein EAI_13516 [Harpegnathos saltator]